MFFLFTVQCPTCGLHLDRIEEVHRLREKRIALEEELKQCQEDLRTKDCRGNNCIIDGHSFRDGELVVNLDDEICLCVVGSTYSLNQTTVVKKVVTRLSQPSDNLV